MTDIVLETSPIKIQTNVSSWVMAVCCDNEEDGHLEEMKEMIFKHSQILGNIVEKLSEKKFLTASEVHQIITGKPDEKVYFPNQEV